MMPSSPPKLVFLAMMLSVRLFAASTCFSHHIVKRNNKHRADKTTIANSTEMSNLEYAPPLWLRSDLLSVNDVPLLTDAGSDWLQVNYSVAKVGNCPSEISLIYKRNNYKYNDKYSGTTDKKTWTCESKWLIKNLEPDSSYTIQATLRYRDDGKLPLLYSYALTARTCSRVVPPIKDLQFHSKGVKWFAVSWIPPEFDCATKLEYRVAYTSLNDITALYIDMGSFRSGNVYNVDGRVRPCFAWPERHCLALNMDMGSQQPYNVTITVRRVRSSDTHQTREEESVKTCRSFDLSDKSLRPGPPVDLRCAEAKATALQLRWRSPVAPVGRLTHVNVQVNTPEGEFVEHVVKEITPSPEYRCTIQKLTPSTCYNVSVWFTMTGMEGASQFIMAWTIPSQSTTTSTSTSTEGYTKTVPSCQYSTISSQQLSVKQKYRVPWIWVAACSLLLFMVFVAFFVGRRYGMQKQWKRSRLEETHSYCGIDKEAIPVKEAGSGGGGVEGTGLYAAAGPAPACTPPPRAQEYAEVDLSTGRAWMGVAAAGQVPGAAGHYEELQDNALYGDTHYANIGERREAPSAYYEVPVGQAAVAPPQPAPAPAHAAAPVPVYAEVDLEKKHAARK